MTKVLDLILQNNPNYEKRLKKITSEVKKDRVKIRSLADEYNKKYSHEIAEGTKRRQLLLTEGAKRGLSSKESERQVISSHGFIPTVHTPNLNWLYFFMTEHKNIKQENKRQQLNEQLGLLTHKEVKVMENSPELFEYLYGNITIGTFGKLKKLKALSKSSNANEAFQAYRACIKLCEEYKVDFDRIP